MTDTRASAPDDLRPATTGGATACADETRPDDGVAGRRAPGVTCRRCPTAASPPSLVEIRKWADEFCLACDHPLFWIAGFGRNDVDEETGADQCHAAPPSRHRRPATSGRPAVPGCAEPNDVKAVFCLRCGSPMDPPAARTGRGAGGDEGGARRTERPVRACRCGCSSASRSSG